MRIKRNDADGHLPDVDGKIAVNIYGNLLNYLTTEISKSVNESRNTTFPTIISELNIP